MTKQLVLRSQTFHSDRRRPLLEIDDVSSRGGMRKVRLGEVAGGTTADCVAVCCCPCGLANLLVMVVYKLPAGLCRKALKHTRHRRMMEKAPGPATSQMYDYEEFLIEIPPVTTGHLLMANAVESMPEDKEVIELEKEMWDKFYSGGFWRSNSQRSEITAL